MDFKEMLKAKINQVENVGNNNSASSSTPRQVTRISSKRSFFGRILPLGDKFPLVEIDRVFVPYKNAGGSVSTIPVVISPDSSDELTRLLKWVISTNYRYRESHQGFNKDIINLFDTPQRYNFHIIHHALMVALELNQNGDGYRVDENGIPDVELYEIPFSAYGNLLNLLNTTPAFKVNGAPFKDDMQFLTSDQTFPVSIKFDGSTNYPVDARPDLVLGAMSFNYLEKNGEEYKYFTDPYEEATPLGEINSTMYNNLLSQLKAKVKDEYQKMKSQDNVEKQSVPTAQHATVQHTTDNVPHASAPVKESESSSVNAMDFMKAPSSSMTADNTDGSEDSDFEATGSIDDIMSDIGF